MPQKNPALHILIPSASRSPRDLRRSSLASERLRLAPMASAAERAGWDVTLGEHQQISANVVVVGKIGSGQIGQRGPAWMNYLEAHKRLNHTLILDYTDHHLATNSVMTPFYKAACELADHICVPNPALADALSVSVDKPIWIIEDLLELKIEAPSLTANGNRGLWFGHQSNAHFLARMLDGALGQKHAIELLVISNSATLEVLRQYKFQEQPKLKIAFQQWSPEAVQNAAATSDFCLIPSDQDSAKRYASNNRLITALALGLPTIATPIPSYKEFSDFFAVAGSEAADKVIADPKSLWPQISRFQSDICNRFFEDAIKGHWLQLFSTLT